MRVVLAPKEGKRTVDAIWRTSADTGHDDLALEGAEDDETELGCVRVDWVSPWPFVVGFLLDEQITVHVCGSGTMTDQALGCPGEVIETDAKANLLDDLIGILGVDVVLDGLHALLVEVLGSDLDQICDFCLE